MQVFSCPVCYDLLLRPVVTPCGHAFCFNCFEGFRTHAADSGRTFGALGRLACPVCRTQLPRSFHGEDPPLAPCAVLIQAVDELCSGQIGSEAAARRQGAVQPPHRTPRPAMAGSSCSSMHIAPATSSTACCSWPDLDPYFTHSTSGLAPRGAGGAGEEHMPTLLTRPLASVWWRLRPCVRARTALPWRQRRRSSS